MSNTAIQDKDTRLTSQSIEWLRFICAALIVLFHCFERVGVETTCSYHNGTYDITRLMFSRGICEIAVPVFFLISGYLFFRGMENWNTSVWVNKIKRRIKTLLVPYILWNIISVMFFVAYGLISSCGGGIFL